jgi:hypothetical protein
MNSYLKTLFLIQTCLFCLLLLIAIISIAYALSRLSRRGVSRELRQNFINRHINYVLSYLLCNIFVVVSRIESLSSHEVLNKRTDTDSQIYRTFCDVAATLFYLQGMIIPLALSKEPLFKAGMMHNLTTFFGICKRQSGDKFTRVDNSSEM